MALQLKRDCSPELLARITGLEKQADHCISGLQLYDYPAQIAVWALLTQYVLTIEESARKFGHGSQKHRESLINLGRSGANALRWLFENARPAGGLTAGWGPELRQAALEMLNVAHNYQAFLTAFPLWHKNRGGMQVLAPARLRFSESDAPDQRRVRAFQQGLRIDGWPSTADEPRGMDFIKDPTVAALIREAVLSIRPAGILGFSYPEPRPLLDRLNELYRDRLKLLSRWDRKVSLGRYTIGDFREFYSALLSICAVHEHLCFERERVSGIYPVESAVLAWTHSRWVREISRNSGLSDETVRAVLLDLTYGRTRPLDLFIHPFISIGTNDPCLFLIPSYPLGSRADENILRVLSLTDPRRYQTFSSGKELLMRDDLRLHNPHGFRMGGPIKLPAGLPDIDLLIEDTASSTIVIAELKWVRKTILPLEHIGRDDELAQGFRLQLKRIQEYLAAHPDHLRSVCACTLSLSSYQNVFYVLAARDHLLWIAPESNRSIVAYDALKKALEGHANLADGMADVLRYDWLPVEGREFRVGYEAARANGVTLEMEVFHRLESSLSSVNLNPAVAAGAQ